VYTSIEFSPKAGGERQAHEEVGLYTVKNDAITREEFFYDGAEQYLALALAEDVASPARGNAPHAGRSSIKQLRSG
jgi:hypothetical protein